MQHAKYQNATQHLDLSSPRTLGTPRRQFRAPQRPVSSVIAAMEALEEIGDIVSKGCFSRPDTLTAEGITAYALALIRVRECAGAAGMDRLMDACDALAVTVSRLIEDHTCASHDKCEALTRFVAHARAMVHATAGRPHGNALASASTATQAARA